MMASRFRTQRRHCLKWLSAAALASWLVAPTMASAQTEIVYWDFIKPGDGSPRGDALARNVEAFQKKYPEIKVKVEVIPPPMIDPNLIQGAAANKTADVLRIDIKYLAKHAQAGSIQPLDKFAGAIDKSDWLLPWDATAIDGKKYGMPYEHRFFALLYRKDILDKAGVTVPMTWDEVCAGAGKINATSVMGYGFGLAQSDNANALLEWVENMIPTGGGKIFDDKGKAVFDDASGKKFFQLIADLTGKCKASSKAVAEFNYNSLTEGLTSGTVAMANLGTHRYLAIRAAGAKDNLAWAPPPSFEPGKPAPVNVTGWNLVMGKAAKNPEAAWKFIEFMTSAEAQLNLAKGGELPSRKSTYADPWFKTPESQFMLGWSDYIAKNGRVGTYPAGWSSFGQILAEATQSIVLQGATPEKALIQAVTTYNKSLGN
ncbi:ABC transporter substrate-binding protein [Bosea sp. PAMC 26642]|uniref:ABC transporter substrate-binding protein n=1 Tax=Bosea sp. (strain PAMC 26642) TaxID=1792307 RepID=UPI0007702654|nr:sugar ABC transporter substrate-binding protein [Bosea sp. PAMC 26642]AMJ61562.1 hypothetical protein AXW83_15740 [Bosea sp. PAMC 26642]